MLLKDSSDLWKTKAISAEKLESHAQKDLIKKKLDKRSLKVAFKIAVNSNNQEKSKLILENIAASYQAITQSEGNSLKLKNVVLNKDAFLKKMAERAFASSPSFHLTLEEIATLYHLPNKMLANIPNIAWGKNLLGEAPENLPIITRDSSEQTKNNTNVIAETVFKNKKVKYGLTRADRRRHVYVIGKTGTGKSTLLANMAINDLKHDEGLCIIDPHGDLIETLLDYIPKRRINDVIYFDPSDQERTVQLNLFEGENVAHRELIASGIISVFQKLYSYSWGPRLEYILRNALLTLLKTEDAKLSDILDLLTDKKYREKVLEKLDDPILMNFWVNEYNKMQDRQRNESIASILNKVGQFVSSPIIRSVVNTSKSSFSIEELMNQGKILLVNLSQGRLGEDNATLLGAMMITKIQLAAMARVDIPEEKRRDFYLYVDEFQNFATDSFNKILSEARKYRLNLTLANQYIDQIPEEVRAAIFGNCGNIISFVMGAGDAEYFYTEYGEKYSKEDLLSLDKYQIINKISIDNVLSSPFPAYTLPIAKSSNQNRDKVVRVSRERYAKKRN
jgi:type IV secretory pathway VirB4 component